MKAIWIVEAKYVSNYSIYLVFNDGIKGEVDLSNKLVGPIFTPLKNMDLFKDFRINSWTLEWPNGADLAPDFVYDLVAEKVTL